MTHLSLLIFINIGIKVCDSLLIPKKYVIMKLDCNQLTVLILRGKKDIDNLQ